MATPKNNSVIKAFDILKLFLSETRPLSPQEVAEATGQTLSTTHRFLLTLEEVGALDRTPGPRYHVGMLISELGQQAMRTDIVAERARSTVDHLSQTFRETVCLSLFHGPEPRPLVWQEASRPLAFRIRSDLDRPLHASATGKLLLACLSPLAREEALEKIALPALTPETRTDMREVRREAQRIALAGLAEDCGEMETGLDCLAAPVTGANLAPLGALVVSAPSARLRNGDRDDIIARLKSAAQALSSQLVIENKTLAHKARPRGSFPHVKRVGNLAFVSGTSSRRRDDTFVGASVTEGGRLVIDTAAQAAATLGNIADILVSVGAGLSSIVQLDVYLTQPEKADAVHAALARHGLPVPPVVTVTAVKALPHPHQAVMMKATAMVSPR